MERIGALPAEWDHFEKHLGLGDLLLPVVSNTAAAISPTSKLKGLGKTPSRYNGAREVVGTGGWTQLPPPKPAELARWKAEPDYGICIRTGGESGLVAIDIDIEDAAHAQRVADVVWSVLGVDLPTRTRANSGKRLLVCRAEGTELYKRICRVEDGIVELLASGQQFVCAGRHSSGTRYAWSAGLPDAIPCVPAEALETCWQAICDTFAVAPPVDASARRRGETVEADDARLDWLEDNYEVYGYGRDGQLYLRCPWKDGHSGDSGESETAYFPAGTGGYAQGHYKCLHASCAGRSDADFDQATGYAASDLVDLEAEWAAEVASAEEQGETLDAPAPRGLIRDGNGKIEALVHNLALALNAPDWTGWRFAYDTFLDEIMVSIDGAPWVAMMDEHRTEYRLMLERKAFKPIKREDLRDMIRAVAKHHRFDSAQLWLRSLKWDGVPRVAGFLPNYFGSADTAYTRAVSVYWWTAHAARVLDPGHQCDMVPILVSEEGKYKSTTLQAMVPRPEMYVEIDLDHKDDNLARRMRGSLIGELAELRGLQGRSGEANKAWVTRRWEEWVPKYVEAATRLPRRLVFVGTTNETAILDGTTGERRWLPVEVSDADRAAIERDREQLWAEAAAMFDKTREVWWQDAYRLGPEARQRFQKHDIWEGAVARWLAGEAVHSSGPHEGFTLEDVFFGALGVSATKCTLSDQHRMGRVLRAMGFELARKRTDGRRLRVWTAADRSRPLDSGPSKMLNCLDLA